MVAVRYKYLDEPEVVIDDANDYDISNSIDLSTTTQWQAVGSYNFASNPDEIKVFCTSVISPLDSTLSEFLWYAELDGNKVRQIYLEPQEGHPLEPVISNWRIGNKPVRHWYDLEDYPDILNPASETRRNPGIPIYLTSSYNPNVRHYQRYYDTPSVGRVWNGLENFKTENLTIAFWHPANGTKLYTLEIFQDGISVFSRTETYRPEYVEVFINDKECPENTCPVKCGENVCCYGSDGIATESFLFNESIYS